MSSHTIEFSVNGGNILSATSLLTADSVEYVKADFTFDQSWAELIKTAVFRVGELVYHTPLEENSCFIPFEVLKEGIMYVSVFGVSGNTRATTNEFAISVIGSGYTQLEPAVASDDPYQYYINKVNELKDLAVNASDTANSAMDTASKSAEQATAAADTASQKADAALDAANSAMATVTNEIENHNSADNLLAHPTLQNIAAEAKKIALGKAAAICFDTKATLDSWLIGDYTRADGKTPADLKIGDNIYIAQTDTPDYWWDGEALQVLEGEKVDLTDYYTKNEIDAKIKNATFELINQMEYDALYQSGNLESGRIYFVYEGDII